MQEEENLRAPRDLIILTNLVHFRMIIILFSSHMKEKPVHSSIEEFRNRLPSVSWTQLQHTANL